MWPIVIRCVAVGVSIVAGYLAYRGQNQKATPNFNQAYSNDGLNSQRHNENYGPCSVCGGDIVGFTASKSYCRICGKKMHDKCAEKLLEITGSIVSCPFFTCQIELEGFSGNFH